MSRPLPTRRRGQPEGGYSDTYDDRRHVDLVEITPDVVVILSGEGWTEETFAAMRKSLRPEVLVIHLPPGDTLEVLDPEEMRATGWVRVEP